MIIVYTVIIGASRIATVWATRYIYRQTFQTITIIFVTTLYIDIHVRKSQRNKDYGDNSYNHKPKSSHITSAGLFSTCYKAQNNLINGNNIDDRQSTEGICWSQELLKNSN